MDTPSLTVVEQGYFIPRGFLSRHDLVYDKDGNLVLAACILRGENLDEDASSAPNQLAESIKGKATESDETVVFMGAFMMPHFGHLITEGMSRFWFFLTESSPAYRIVCGAPPFGASTVIKKIFKPGAYHWQRFLRCLHLDRSHFAVTMSPVRFRKILVPEATWVERNHTFPVHFDLTRTVAKNLIEEAALDPDPRPVYLSRNRLKAANLRYRNEELVEKYCRESGWRIIYPERLSLRDQAIIANKHAVFAGCIGSAFHTLLFRYVDPPFKCLYLGMDKTYPNYKMMDQLIGSKSKYVACVFRNDDDALARDIDSACAIAALANVD